MHTIINLEDFLKMNTFTTRSLLENIARTISYHHSLFQSSSAIGTANAQSCSIAKLCSSPFPPLYALVTILSQPSSPHETPQELRTIQYSVPFSTPQPAIDTMWLIIGEGLYSVQIPPSKCLKFRSGHYATWTPGIDFGHHFNTSTNFTCRQCKSDS